MKRLIILITLTLSSFVLVGQPNIPPHPDHGHHGHHGDHPCHHCPTVPIDKGLLAIGVTGAIFAAAYLTLKNIKDE